ncbi:hypothetical protein [Microcoleus sp. CAWBG27]|nr:hypothetical protein [Microcoleus sp. CAWBG27]
MSVVTIGSGTNLDRTSARHIYEKLGFGLLALLEPLDSHCQRL